MFTFWLNTEPGQTIKRANIIENVKANLVTEYRYSLNQVVANDDLTMIDLSAADDRQTAIYLYDLEEQPAVFTYFESIQNDNEENPIPLFEFDIDNLADLEGYFISIGDFENNVILYRKQMPINLFRQARFI
jgi:hypothetical protein